ncbi:hypothetical protein TNCV_873511 [Trichonephila clavipes]|nr:hypothetical protein TNCV_873511 [Trichonephila clavipes]
MPSEKDKALLVKLFFMNKESATVALRKFRNVKTGKGPSTVVRLVKLVQSVTIALVMLYDVRLKSPHTISTAGTAAITYGSWSRTRGGRGSLVVKVLDRGWPCHEFEPSTT